MDGQFKRNLWFPILLGISELTSLVPLVQPRKSEMVESLGLAVAQAAQMNTMKMIVEGYEATKYQNYLAVGGFALVVADYLHTLPDEVRLIWPGKMSLPKGLFFVMRYYILFHHVLAVLYGERVGLSPAECKASFDRVSVSVLSLVVAAEALLFLRVYTFSGKSRKMLAYLIIQFTAIHATAFALLFQFLRSVKYIKYPFRNMTCMPVQLESPLLAGVFSLLLLSVIIVMLIMVWIAFQKHRNLNSALLKIFYRDGVFYFICLSALASANIVVSYAAPEGFKFLFVQTEADIHVLLATRMLLHLRGWAERERDVSFGPQASEPEWETIQLPYQEMATIAEPMPSSYTKYGRDESLC